MLLGDHLDDIDAIEMSKDARGEPRLPRQAEAIGVCRSASAQGHGGPRRSASREGGRAV
jgi:hypothetical protein